MNTTERIKAATKRRLKLVKQAEAMCSALLVEFDADWEHEIVGNAGALSKALLEFVEMAPLLEPQT